MSQAEFDSSRHQQSERVDDNNGSVDNSAHLTPHYHYHSDNHYDDSGDISAGECDARHDVAVQVDDVTRQSSSSQARHQHCQTIYSTATTLQVAVV